LGNKQSPPFALALDDPKLQIRGEINKAERSLLCETWRFGR
jgi:hypothetical protein